MQIQITHKVTVEVDLHSTPFADWPEAAKTTAAHILEREMRKRQPDLFPRSRLVELVEARLAVNEFDL